jgi:L-amino acid N-acyltransferase YncA
MNAPFTDHRQAQIARHSYRLATVDDVAELAELFREFFHESDLPSFGLTFDIGRMHRWLLGVTEAGSVPHVVAIDKRTGLVVGAIAYRLMHNYTDRPIAQMDKFYVRRDHRRSAAGRTLLTLAIEMARDDGAALFQVFVNSGIAGSRNIFDRFGFRETPHSRLLGKEL